MPSVVVFTSPNRKGHQSIDRLILGLASMTIMWWRQDSDSDGPLLEVVLLYGVACPGQQGKGLCSQGNHPGWLLREVSEEPGFQSTVENKTLLFSGLEYISSKTLSMYRYC